MHIASLIIISTQKVWDALQSKCHPIYIATLSCEWGLLSQVSRKSCHVGDEEIRWAEGRHYSAHQSSAVPCSSLTKPNVCKSVCDHCTNEWWLWGLRVGRNLPLICCDNPDLAAGWGPLLPLRTVPLRLRQVRYNCHAINNIECCKLGDTAMWAGGPLWREHSRYRYYSSLYTALITHYCQISYRTTTH